jgi:molybdopterin molybdotransferase
VDALVSVDEALRLVLERARPLPPVVVAVADAAGRVLVESARAAVALPPFHSSAMDGFAVRAADTPGTLRVVARSAAGRPAVHGPGPGEAVGIATGAVVPDGADAVVPVERVVENGDAIDVPSAVEPGRNIRGRGGDVREGEVVIPAGVRLGAAQIAALCAAGVSEVLCGSAPRVAVLTTGTELRASGDPLAPGQIYESNGSMLSVVLERAGASPELHPPAPDDPVAHRQVLEQALRADVVVTSGGVSVGPHDLVRRTAADLGVHEVFWGVAMRPGKPLAFGVRGPTLVFGLPGNPVSSLVGALLFVVPAVLALQGAADPAPRWRGGVLASPLERNEQRDDFARARTRLAGGVTTLEPIGGQESHMITRAARADALVHVPRGTGAVAAGAPVHYLTLD